MPSTTVHIPDPLLAKIDHVVREKNMSRNRFIVQACEAALENDSGDWPDGFFDAEFDEKNGVLLREGVREMEEAILMKRKSRSGIEL